MPGFGNLGQYEDPFGIGGLATTPYVPPPPPNGGVNVAPGDTEQAWQAWQLQQIQDNATRNQGLIAPLSGQNTGIGVTTNNVRQGQTGIVQDTANRAGAYNQQTQALVDQLTGVNNNANAFDWNALGPYQSGLAANSASNTGYVNGLTDLFNSPGMQRLSPTTSWGGDLSSQAAQAYADPSSIAAQNNAMGFLSGAMNGSLNYTSQGAQAYADPQAIQAQYQALGQLQGAANGNLNVTSQAANVFADPALVAAQQKGVDSLWGVSQGAGDIAPGQLNPEAFAAQKDALAQYGALTTPKLTDAERFIYENERMMAERDERSNREGVMANLRQRGMGGSGMELTNSALANQQVSQNRLLGDLGANAMAVNRSMQALQGYGGLSTAMTNEADQMQMNNKNRQLAALGMYTDAAGQMRSRAFDEAMQRGTAADQVAMTNMNRELQAMGMAADTAGNIRNSSFNEAYSRGIAADNASANNQQTQLSGGIAYGNMANTQRQQSFNESFSRGTAADQTAQFNRAQSIGVSEFQDTFNQNAQNAQWGRATDVTGAGLQADKQNAQNLGDSWSAGYNTNKTTTERTQQSLAAQDNANTRNWNDTNYWQGELSDLGDKTVNDANTSFGRNATIAGLGVGVNNNTTSGLVGVGQQFAGTAASRSAAKGAETAAALAAANAPSGLLGTGILGKHDPLNPGNWFRGSIS